jgi:hypothetical protein
MSILHKAVLTVVIAGFCLGSVLYAAEGAPAKDGDGARMGPPDGQRGPGNREGADQRMRPPQGLPLLGDVTGMKEELQKHQETMRALQEQIREAIGKPEGRGDRGEPKDGPKDGQKGGPKDGVKNGPKDAPKDLPEAVKAKLDEIAPKIVDEFIRHYQAVDDLIKANRDDAIAKLKERLANPPPPPPPGRGQNGPGGQRGERGDGPPAHGERGQNAPIPGGHNE